MEKSRPGKRKLSITTEYLKRAKDYKYEPPVYSIEFQMGLLIGHIVWQAMPTLDIYWIHSWNVIKVTDEEREKRDELLKKWYDPETMGIDRVKNEQAWVELKQYEHSLEKKYFPPKYEKLIDIVIPKHPDVLKGIISFLWSCDGCTYSIDEGDIEIETHEKYVYRSTVKMIYKEPKIFYSGSEI
jgi:hypothetical protein